MLPGQINGFGRIVGQVKKRKRILKRLWYGAGIFHGCRLLFLAKNGHAIGPNTVDIIRIKITA